MIAAAVRVLKWALRRSRAAAQPVLAILDRESATSAVRDCASIIRRHGVSGVLRA
jgi:hypothetical protein